MSAFFVDKWVIDVVTGLVSSCDEYHWLTLRRWDHLGESATEIGRNLWKLNFDGVAARYALDAENLASMRKEIREYVYSPVRTSRMQRLKSLECLLYQCAEGNGPKRKLFKGLREIGRREAYRIVAETKEWRDARWG
jgi:hypothetical protein